MRISGRGSGVLTHDFRMLFGVGTAAGLTNAQLLRQFAANRDPGAQAAFAAMVARYGPMVLRVCGTILREPTDIEDAFQATFLVLARKARSIREPDSVGSWLYGVALRTASSARLAAIRRRRHERQSTAAAATRPAEEDGDDFASALWEEVDRLAEKYRAPVVLCYLEGLTHEAAARHLGWPVGTVEGRLARARGVLRSRLTRRGLAPAIGLLGASTSAQATPTAIPGVTADCMARLAMFFIDGRTVARDLVPIRPAALAKQVLGTTFPTVIKTAVTVVMMVILTASARGHSVLRLTIPARWVNKEKKSQIRAGPRAEPSRLIPHEQAVHLGLQVFQAGDREGPQYSVRRDRDTGAGSRGEKRSRRSGIPSRAI